MGVSFGSSIYNAPSIYESGAGGGGGGGGGLQPDEIVIGDQVLQTVQINDQIWTTKNFDSFLPGITYNTGETFPLGPHCWYYGRDPATYGIYGENRGLLYTFPTQNIIQTWLDENLQGWRIPTKNDWDKLVNFAGGYNLSTLYKLGDTRLWTNTNLFTNDFGLSIIPTGFRDDRSFTDLIEGIFWSSTNQTPFALNCTKFSENDGVITSFPLDAEYDACAYRFVKDA